MTIAAAQLPTRNDARTMETRARLVDSTIDALIELGFAKTTGVEICRRSGLTRGALNHHFPDFADLLVDTLVELYTRLLAVKAVVDCGRLEAVLRASYERVIQPEFKAVIELWLASQNDPEFGSRLAAAIHENAPLFSPAMVLQLGEGFGVDQGVNQGVNHGVDEEGETLYYTMTETLIGIGLGRAVGRGESLAHEARVLGMLQSMARDYDQTLAKAAKNNPTLVKPQEQT
ncbi:transcriptional regulator, TetR family [Congregibacter litoralis KT71]|uniref:Transcriptional regulator, TetR family n=2 Tax=Congregibacter TaxID=393661 RepID=A4A9K4_9GAMM|nr:transcriptional regulator, TetR family [Congregibacter litoralis KT71]